MGCLLGVDHVPSVLTWSLSCCVRYHNISLGPGRFGWNCRWVIFWLILVIDGWGVICCPQVIFTGCYGWEVTIGSGNGLVPSGNKALLEPMLTEITDAIWGYYATVSYNRRFYKWYAIVLVSIILKSQKNHNWKELNDLSCKHISTGLIFLFLRHGTLRKGS